MMRTAIVWFRQDLRLNDNPAFFQACSQYDVVIPLYIYEDNHSVLGRAQAWWLHHSLEAFTQSLNKKGLFLTLRKGNPQTILLELIKTTQADAIFWNRCYEPHAIARDTVLKKMLLEKEVDVESFNGGLLHEPWTIKNSQGEFYQVFTSYWKKCRMLLNVPMPFKINQTPKGVKLPSDALNDWNLLPSIPWDSQFPKHWNPGEEGAKKRLKKFIEQHLQTYKNARDYPAKNATSGLSAHLHFGEISPWDLVRAIELAKLDKACNLASAEHFLSELGWREFSYYLLYHFPQLPSENFKTEFNAFPWEKNNSALLRWQKGMTGYPLVDAGMRELWATGYMHNRVRMVVASFLTKSLLIDWRLGAKWFLDTLVDADLANNSASWQWVAGSGVDAAPYFRIFNPVLQSQKFDLDGQYIRQWIPELAKIKGRAIHEPWNSPELTEDYPMPIIEHQVARQRALASYEQIKTKKNV